MTASLRDLLFLAGKAFLACLATILLGHAVGNPDHVSSTFVAVLSVSAVALAGLRTGLTQLAGSALGGVWGTLAALAGVPHQVAVPAAVALAIVTAFAVRAGSAYPIAAFVTGLLAERGFDRRYLTSVLAMSIGLAIVFAGGVLWIARLTGVQTALATGLYPFVVVDAIKVIAAGLVLPTAWKFLRH